MDPSSFRRLAQSLRNTFSRSSQSLSKAFPGLILNHLPRSSQRCELSQLSRAVPRPSEDFHTSAFRGQGQKMRLAAISRTIPNPQSHPVQQHERFSCSIASSLLFWCPAHMSRLEDTLGSRTHNACLSTEKLVGYSERRHPGPYVSGISSVPSPIHESMKVERSSFLLPCLLANTLSSFTLP